MPENRFDLPDAAWAFLIGAITGIGAVLLLRPPDDEAEEVIQALRERGIPARRASARRSRQLDEIVACSRMFRDPDAS